MEFSDIPSCIQDFNDLGSDFKVLEECNKEYLKKLDEVSELQSKCVKEINHQRYRMSIIRRSLKRLKKKGDEKDLNTVLDLEKDLQRREGHLSEIEQCLPKPNGLYLKIILGNVNVSILNKNDKFKYKDEYEKFKLVLSIIGFVLAVMNLAVTFRVLELCLLFLLVWYYCTLTIRESILKVNGSRIKGWWRLHHFLSTVEAAILLIWPNNSTWYQFRWQFMWFNVYISIVQYMQFRYQQGILYRLKALGERHNMDITIEGFHSWMFRGLSFLFPFLLFGYIFQLGNAVTLYNLSFHPEATWQVPVSSALFFVLFIGNFVTTSLVIPQKIKEYYKITHTGQKPTAGSQNKPQVSGETSAQNEKHHNKINAVIEDTMSRSSEQLVKPGDLKKDE